VKMDVVNQKGEKVSQIELSNTVFAVPFNESLVHQAMVMHLANRRLGTADTKTRGEVLKSTRKLFNQKHTGRARRGSAKTPLLKGGGVAFGPKPRNYRQEMPRKMRRLALRCVLSAKAGSGQLIILDKFIVNEPKTKDIFDMLVALGIDTTVLIAIDGVDDALFKSVRNLAGVKILAANLMNVTDLLGHNKLVMTAGAINKAQELWGSEQVKKSAELK